MTLETMLELRRWLEGLHATGGYRGLVVAHSSSVWGEAARLAGLLRGALDGPLLCIAPSEGRRLLAQDAGCDRLASPGAVEEILGWEAAAAVIAVRELLRPNLLAAAAEAVKAGGVVALSLPPLREWRPGGPAGTGAYKRYLLDRLYEARSIFWYCGDRGTVYLSRLPGGRAAAPPGPEGLQPRTPGMPARLLAAAANREQAEAIDRAAGWLVSRRGRSLLVTGDRGRGKSGLLGLLAAWLAKTGRIGFLPVTAPSPWSVQGFFRVLSRGLDALGIRHWTIERGGLVIGVAGKWFHVRYHTPDQVHPGAYTFVDEAAALGPSRVRAIAARSPRIVAATTIHGYEGSGRVFARMVERILPEPRLVLKLETPVRYPPGDPLEEWLYRAFMLRAEAGPPPRSLEPLRAEEVDRGRLAESYEELARVYSILVEAHYRNEPDDLALILDAPHHRLYVLYAEDKPVAVADVARETGETPWDARILYDLLPGSPGPGARIVRIAVHPELQRRGLGSRLLRFVEDREAAGGAEWIGAVFGRAEVLGFWLRNGYMVVHVSPLPNRVTGEHNLGVAKPLRGSGAETVSLAAADAMARLLYASHSLYRSLPVETLAAIIAHPRPLPREALPVPEKPGRLQLERAARVAAGEADAEHAIDALTMMLRCALLAGEALPWREALVAAGRLLQGRTMRELEPLLGGREAYREALSSLANHLIRVCMGTPGRGEGGASPPSDGGAPGAGAAELPRAS